MSWPPWGLGLTPVGGGQRLVRSRKSGLFVVDAKLISLVGSVRKRSLKSMKPPEGPLPSVLVVRNDVTRWSHVLRSATFILLPIRLFYTENHRNITKHHLLLRGLLFFFCHTKGSNISQLTHKAQRHFSNNITNLQKRTNKKGELA